MPLNVKSKGATPSRSPDFENFSIFKPAPQQEKSVNAMLDQVIAWGSALKTLREKQT